ncbi:MAG: hypothetical protein Q8Q88_17265, partial [Phenylobacterium sp.]|uniref:hypothetical protein n=1 Tax=Phenylobacterium sp. TaxID=1871053 RepID=UPI0027367D47
TARHERLDPRPLIVPKNLAFQHTLQREALNQNSASQGILNRHYRLVSEIAAKPESGAPRK